MKKQKLTISELKKVIRKIITEEFEVEPDTFFVIKPTKQEMIRDLLYYNNYFKDAAPYVTKRIQLVIDKLNKSDSIDLSTYDMFFNIKDAFLSLENNDIEKDRSKLFNLNALKSRYITSDRHDGFEKTQPGK